MDNAANKPRPSRAKFYVDRKGRFVHDAVIFLMLSAVFRVIGCWGLWNDRGFLISQILLPVAACFIFAFCLTVLGEKLLPATMVPMALGAVFFIVRSLGFESWVYTTASIILYIVVLLSYGATVLGFIRTKWLLVPLIALPFLYRVLIVDAAALADSASPVLFSEGMQELSALAMVIALVFTALAMKKRQPFEEAKLPKIKDPVVIIPKKAAAEEAAAKTEDTARAPETENREAAGNSAENAATPDKEAKV